MNLDQLEYFQVIASYQSISRAAEVLHISQPALSNTLAKLEEELGVKLFDRKGKRLVLNRQGEEFLAGVEHSMRILQRTTSRIRNANQTENAIRIGLRIESRNLFSLVREFRQLHPEAQFNFYTYSEPKENSAIQSFDFAVHPDYADYGLPRRLLDQRKQMLAVLPPAHPLAGRESIRLEELKDETFAFVSPDGKRFSQPYQICIDSGFTPRVGFVAAGYGLITAEILVRHTGCVALGYDSGWHSYRNQDVVYVPVEGENFPQRKIYLGWNEENMRDSAKGFLEFIKTKLPPEEDE